MFRLKMKISEFLYSSYLLINNSISVSEISRALADHGFTEEKLRAGKLLCEEADALHSAQKMASGIQEEATHQLKSLWAEAKQKYMKALKIARVAFKDLIRAEQTVFLKGDREQNFSGWLGQARLFYTNILKDNELLELMTGFGYSRDKLQQENAMLDQLEGAYLRQKKAMGEARQATLDRDQKLNELAGWVSALKVVVKVALGNDSQQLEKLGIVVRRK